MALREQKDVYIDFGAPVLNSKPDAWPRPQAVQPRDFQADANVDAEVEARVESQFDQNPEPEYVVDNKDVETSLVEPTVAVEATTVEASNRSAPPILLSPDQSKKLIARPNSHPTTTSANQPAIPSSENHQLLAVVTETPQLLKRVGLKMTQINDILAKVPAMAKISEHGRKAVAKSMRAVEFKAGEIIIKQGDIGDTFYIIDSGEVAVDIDGKEPIILKEGMHFGEMALLKNEARTATIRAHGECKCLELSRKVYEKHKTKKTSNESTLRHIILFLQCLCLVYSGIVLVPNDFGGITQWNSFANVTLCPRETICSEGPVEVALLFGSRGSAYFMYPVLGAVFLTKCHGLNSWLANKAISLYVPLVDLHNLHAKMGIMIAMMALVHTIFHVARWVIRGELGHQLSTHVGVSGAIATALCVPICLLMRLPQCLKKMISWEFRKGAHMLCVIFGVALCFHTLRLTIFMGVVILIYFSDKIYQTCALTFKIQNSHFRRLPTSVQLTYKNPANWRCDNTGYINIAVPWVSKHEWHPFSVYPHSTRDGYSCVCINVAGDWTKKLHESISRPTTRPVWVQGPFASPFHSAMEYDKLLMVASGIGITPALSCVQSHEEEKRITLLWMCRDPSLVEFFVATRLFCSFDNTCVLIYYTGKAPIDLSILARDTNQNIRIVPGRPDTLKVIAELIQAREEGLPLPSHIIKQSIDFTVKTVLAASSDASTALSPFQRLENVGSKLREAGLSAKEVAAVFGVVEGAVLTAQILERSLHSIGMTDFCLRECETIIKQLDSEADGFVSESKVLFFFERIGTSEQHARTDTDHRLRKCALDLLQIVGDAPGTPLLIDTTSDSSSQTTKALTSRSRSTTKSAGWIGVDRGTVVAGITSDITEKITLNNLSDRDVAFMRPFLRLYKYSPGELIMQEGDVGDGNIYFLISGTAVVETSQMRNQGVQAITIKAGTSFGEIALW
eukprot:SAG11_NODE_690_length_7706_cov_7.429078_2_plen_963_part_00